MSRLITFEGLRLLMKPGAALVDIHPALWAKFLVVRAMLAVEVPDTDWIITQTRGSSALHNVSPIRAIDFRAEPYDLMTHIGVTAALKRVRDRFNTLYPYGVGDDGRWHDAFVYMAVPAGTGTDPYHERHVHLQEKGE